MVGGDASFGRRPFFLLDSQVIRIFSLKNRLIILRAVTYVIRGRILGPGLWALICLGLLNRGAGPKAMVPTRMTRNL